MLAAAREYADKNVILASSSPRRRAILRDAGFVFSVVKSDFPETLSKLDKTPSQYVLATALEKAKDVALRIKDFDLLIAADSIVVANKHTILEKPIDAAHAREMLMVLTNTTHEVMTAVVLVVAIVSTSARSSLAEIMTIDGKLYEIRHLVETTRVEFGDIQNDIDDYIVTNDWTDKAGAYGYQSIGAVFVKRIEGCYYNVVGFPLYQTLQLLRSKPLMG